MAPQKRKQPDKKRKTKSRAPSLAMRGLRIVGSGLALGGRLAARNPGPVGGAAAFFVVFSFVAANALWYQPGAHPSPFLRTRLPLTSPDPSRLTTGETSLDPKTVTTFVIKREGEAEAAAEASPDAATPTQSVPQQAAAERPQPSPQADVDSVASIIAGSAPEVDAAQNPKLIASVQEELVRRGFYDGQADGKMGPKTVAAIQVFERQAGRPVTGAASEQLLASLRSARKTVVAAKPDSRPYETVKAEKGELDPVAAAIRQANIDPQYIPKADIPASSELVMNIQRGLVNLAYADVTVDGVAGDQTREAIRHFEKHYRLPPTGEPSETVLRKMKDIGAL
ncbi:peptidoglycan hydrolase-like protein with peptidoglycan-binding domain [Pararhizobium capsulatum DSM 1112]|uniref:Peptidoglycan hydrolase-like protein with peptidoglycan-binding domain n=1 Tax=Pararhizobium capsulatum DSM 1112 TaxID=1121113 RepID=A0ABU0BRS8_9HYPH|nr:peptidoglycan-binding domain-containing protein [Pararhizobium capsulatum]MDQ0319582.1 peptidoglycan hydrolase-like protein with peptidoglycan-binding domain [Pararhizobium capsulatum DSM 1112]